MPALPSPDWELAGRRTIRFAVAYAVAAAAVVPLFAWATRKPVDEVTVAAATVIANLVISALLLGGLLGLLVCAVVWLVQTARLAYGSPPTGHLGYWGCAAFGVLFVAAYVPPPGLRLADALLLAAGERLLGVILLIAGVVHTRRWIRRRAGTPVPARAGGFPSSRPTAEDWSTGWDPEVERDIERRRAR
ncbi:hypothetical protein Acy02nite_27730 [Actinoplanes cyaneus]|uniref:Uncharacterized protein n=1 Tax=Actinoplanes cyaneus TaxID=52696 RepID=A0A919IIB5_9ACTN|nr:hypothetical protein [Actinoplanes cyaneus]GID64892.1 hypothetical protein Acy02nite_27730 [Actinoplanes cyaneus]